MMAEEIDYDAVNELKEFIRDKFPELVETYVRNAARYAEAVVEGFAEGDAKKIADAAHPLKSSSGNMGLLKLSELSEQIEDMASEVVDGGRSLEDLLNLVGQIVALNQKSSELLEEQV